MISINLASLIIASTSHWATTDETQIIIFVVIVFEAAFIASVFGLMIFGFLCSEIFFATTEDGEQDAMNNNNKNNKH